MNNTYIYSLSDPTSDQVKYIGKTNYPKRRYAAHFKKANMVHLKKEEWINSLKKIGLKPKMSIEDEVPISEWGFWEQYYISLYKSWGFSLLNATSGGGHDSTGFKHSEHSKKLMSEKQKRLFQNPEERERMRKINTGKKASEETRRKMREIQSRLSTLSKPVLQFDRNMNLLNKFHNAQKASRAIGESFGVISKHAISHSITQNGFAWRFETDKDFLLDTKIRIKKGINKCNADYKKQFKRYIKYFSPSAELRKRNNNKIGREKFGLIMKEKFKNSEYKKEHIKHLDISREKQKKSVSQFDLNRNFIKTYESMHEAGRVGGFDFKKISECAIGRQKTHKNFIWKFAEKK